MFRDPAVRSPAGHCRRPGREHGSANAGQMCSVFLRTWAVRQGGGFVSGRQEGKASVLNFVQFIDAPSIHSNCVRISSWLVILTKEVVSDRL